MPITNLPTPPTRSDPVNFNSRADAFLTALPAFAAEANALQNDVNAKQSAAATSATNALASENAAAANSGATIWVSGTTYAIGNVRFSPITYLSYRRKTAGAGTTDPSADNTNWQLINGTGNVDLTSTQTLTNKTFSTGSVWNGSAVPIANGGTGATTAATARSNLGTNNAANIDTGVISTAILGVGIAGNTTYLRGDNTWQTVQGKLLLGSWTYSTNVATINFLNLAYWDEIDIQIEGVTSNTSINWIRVSFDNGSSFQTTGYDGRVADAVDGTTTTTSLDFTRGENGTIVGKTTISNMLVRAIQTSNCCIGSRVVTACNRAPAGTVNAIQIGAGGIGDSPQVPSKSTGLSDEKVTIIGEYELVEDMTQEEIDALIHVPQPVTVVTMRQARLALLQQGLLPQVQLAIDSLPSHQKEAAQIEWDYSSEVHRDKPFVQLLGAALGLTDAQLDDLFILAAGL